MKRFLSLLLMFALLLTGCTGSSQTSYTKYSTQFYGTFDTVVQIIGYCQTEDQFKAYAQEIQDRFTELSHLFDIYYDYSGINNIKTINDNAGIAPVRVDKEIVELVKFCLDNYETTGGRVNIALGPVLSIWHRYMEQYQSDSTNSQIPDMAELKEAEKHTDITKVKVDEEAETVYLEEKGMALDVGAVAKGYATQIVCDEMVNKGFTSLCISAGGNVVTEDPPLDSSRTNWGIIIQSPFAVDDPTATDDSLDVAEVSHECVVTSGDYQRYYMYGDQRIHHIIDVSTLMPATYYRAVTIITENSGMADLASTTLFTLPFEESQVMAKKMGWRALWVFSDGTVKCNDEIIPLLRIRGGATG